MSWVDIAIIGIVVLFAGLGLWRGVQKSALYVGTFLVSFIIAFFLSTVIAEALLNIEAVKAFVFGKDIAGKTGFSLYGWILNADAKAPSDFIQGHFVKPIMDIVLSHKTVTSNALPPANAYALYLAFTTFSLIIGLGLFLVIRFLLCIVTMIIKSYIPRKKSGANRAAGFFVGLVRGAIWAFALTIAFSVVGGFTWASFVNSTETEYEKSVIAKYVNQGSYAIKNSMFLPNKDMFGRLINISGLAGEPIEEDEEKPDEGEVDALLQKKNSLYVEIMNLNYTDSVYEMNDDGTYSFDTESTALLDYEKYACTGFGEVVKAITDYNKKVGDAILDGLLDGNDSSVYDDYIVKVRDIAAVLYEGDNNIGNQLDNYKTQVEHVPEALEGEKASMDADMKEYYDNLVEKLDVLKTKYAALELIIANEDIGEIAIPEYPDHALTFDELKALAAA